MANYENGQERDKKGFSIPNDANWIMDGLKNNTNTTPSTLHNPSNTSINDQNNNGNESKVDTRNPAQSEESRRGHPNGSNLANQVRNVGQPGSKTSTASGAGVAATGGKAGSAASGAVAGSLAPGIGTAIGASVGKAADNAKRAREASDAANNMEFKARGGNGYEYSKNQNVADSNIAIKVIIGIVSVFAALIATIIILCNMMVESVAAPVMAVFKLIESGHFSISGLFNEDSSFAEIQTVFLEDIQEAFSRAYTEVCQNEVYQIAVEQEYDIELTMESYNNTKFPYILSGEDCNVNYAEIFNIISLADELNLDDWKNFSYEKYCELYEDPEFLRTLYTLKVERTEKYIINEAMLAQGEYCEIHSDRSVTITHADGSTSTFTGEAAEAYYDIIIYGEVSVSSYGLLEIFDYFSIDPYAASSVLPNMTNWKAMEYQEYFTRCYEPDAFWGNEERSKLIPYEHQTGELVEDAGGMYVKDIFDSMIITEDYVFFDVVEYKQADPRWGTASYLGHSMASYGCCVTSMAMVINYYGSAGINPGNLLDKMNKEYSGSLNRPALSEQFGFWHYLDDNSFSLHSDLTKITGALSNEQLVMAHIKPNSSEHFSTKNGHWIVLHGYQRVTYDGNSAYAAMVSDGSPGFFYVNDPNRNNEIMTFMEAANLIDRIQSYGYR